MLAYRRRGTMQPPKQPGPPARGDADGADRPSAVHERAPALRARAADGGAIILAVERDPHVRALETYFLNEAGFSVEFADDGYSALAMARALVPRIIITELLVPGLDGLALCRAVKSDPVLRSIAVLVFSILAAETRAREAGADAFLLKPLGDRRLIDTVRELLATRGERPVPTASSPPVEARP